MQARNYFNMPLSAYKVELPPGGTMMPVPVPSTHRCVIVLKLGLAAGHANVALFSNLQTPTSSLNVGPDAPPVTRHWDSAKSAALVVLLNGFSVFADQLPLSLLNGGQV
jgi:hypothetical protein